MTGQRETTRYAVPSLRKWRDSWVVYAEGHYVGVVKEHPSGWTAMTHKGAYAGLYPTKQAAAEVLVKQAGYELEMG